MDNIQQQERTFQNSNNISTYFIEPLQTSKSAVEYLQHVRNLISKHLLINIYTFKL